MEPKLISIRDFCLMVGVGRTTAYKLMQSKVRSTKIGSRRLIDRQSAENFVSEKLSSESVERDQ